MCCIVDETMTPKLYQLSAVTLSGRVSVTVMSGKSTGNYLMFTGCRLNENKLRDLLQECVPVMYSVYTLGLVKPKIHYTGFRVTSP